MKWHKSLVVLSVIVIGLLAVPQPSQSQDLTTLLTQFLGNLYAGVMTLGTNGTLRGVSDGVFAVKNAANNAYGTLAFAVAKPGSDSTTAFQIANASGTGLFTFDTTNGRVAIGKATAPSFLIDAVFAANANDTIKITNSTSGTAASANLGAAAGTTSAVLYALSQGYTTSGRFVQGGGLLEATGAGGANISAASSSAPIRFFANGATEYWDISGTTGSLIAATDGGVSIGASAAGRPASTWLQSPAITAGSGTGITLNDSGQVRTLIYKITVATTAFVCAATTCDVTVATLPAKTFVRHALADLTQTFACAATCTSATLSATLGKTAGGNQYLLSWNLNTTTGQFGKAAAELGASLAASTTPTENGDLSSWSATTAVVLRMTSGTGNIGNGTVTNLSQGSVTVYLTTTVMP